MRTKINEDMLINPDDCHKKFKSLNRIVKYIHVTQFKNHYKKLKKNYGKFREIKTMD